MFIIMKEHVTDVFSVVLGQLRFVAQINEEKYTQYLLL